MGASFSTMPPWGSAAEGREWRLTVLTPCTISRCSARSTLRTSPVLPLSRPVRTTTESPFLILSFCTIPTTIPVLEHLGRQRDDLHVAPGPKLARHGSENARADRLAQVVDEHRRITIEADGAAIGAPDGVRRAHDHGLQDVALLDLAARDRVLDRDHDDVADRRRPAPRAAEHLDALDATGAGVVRNIEVGLRADHRVLASGHIDCQLFRRGATARPLDHLPALALGEGSTLADAHDVAGPGRVVRIVRHVLFRARHELLVDRVQHLSFDEHDDGLVRLVADHDAREDSLRHRCYASVRPARAFSSITVLRRAMSRRTTRIRALFASWPPARWKRRLNASFLS